MPTSRSLFGGVLQTTPGHRGMPTSRCLLAANVARSNERAAIDLNHEIFVLNFKKSFSLIKESLIRAQALFFVHHTSWPFKTYFENGVQYGGSNFPQTYYLPIFFLKWDKQNWQTKKKEVFLIILNNVNILANFQIHKRPNTPRHNFASGF